MFNCQFCTKEFSRKCDCSRHEHYYCEKNPNKETLVLKNPYVNHKKAECKICGKLIDVANIKRHEQSCGRPDNQVHVEHDGLSCIYCGKLLKHKNSLAQHEIRCPKNPNRKAFDNLSTYSTLYRRGETKYTRDDIRRASDTLKLRYANGEIAPFWKGREGVFKGRHHTESTKEKVRLSTIKYIQDTTGGIKQRYNKAACQYIENINQKNNWHLQHAENGGEVCIGGYFLDGYDKDLNIAFEYDEPKHYRDVDNNILKDKDVDRMNYIISKINCQFYRYNEKLDLFYKIR